MTLSLASPWFALLALPLVFAMMMSWRPERNATLKFSNTEDMPRESLTVYKHLHSLVQFLRWAALFLLVFALCRPQIPDREVLTGEGIDVMVALDMSASMNAVDSTEKALDEKLDSGEKPLNRFEIARQLLGNFVSNREEDRLGLVIFGQDAFLKFPLTLDYNRILALLNGLILDTGERNRDNAHCINQCTIDGGGTAIGDALARSYQRLRQSTSVSKVIVLITDGNNEGGKLQPETVLQYIEDQMEETPVRIYSFLIGDDTNSFIPRRDRFGNLSYQAAPRPYPTNPELLKSLAEKTGGQFFASYDEEQFRQHFAELERTEFQTRVTTQYKDIFPIFCWIALTLILLNCFIRFVVWREFP